MMDAKKEIMPIQIKDVPIVSCVWAVSQDAFRSKFCSTRVAAIGNIRMTTAPHSACKVFARLVELSVMAFVLNIPAPISAVTIRANHQRLIDPPTDVSEGQ